MLSRTWKTLLRDDRGQDLAEYGIALSVIVVAVALIAVALGNNVIGLWSNAETKLTDVAAAG